MQFYVLRRREFIALLGGAVTALPSPAAAQQRAPPVVGYLTSVGPNDRPNLVAAFRRGLSQAGYIEGRNVTVEYRFADNQYDRLAALAADLVGRNAAVILAAGGGASILAAAATTVPIVFTTGGDPVGQKFVSSLNRPGGNVTGVSWFAAQISAKALGLLHELIPNAALIALLVNPRLTESARAVSDAQEATRTLGLQLLVLNVSTRNEINAAFATLRQRRAGALLVVSDPFLATRRQQIVTLATRDAVPDVYTNREFADEGGLMSYGNDTADAYYRAAGYVARILQGEKPGDLPVDQTTKFELVINAATAKALGLTLPASMQLLADEVIE